MAPRKIRRLQKETTSSTGSHVARARKALSETRRIERSLSRERASVEAKIRKWGVLNAEIGEIPVGRQLPRNEREDRNIQQRRDFWMRRMELQANHLYLHGRQIAARARRERIEMALQKGNTKRLELSPIEGYRRQSPPRRPVPRKPPTISPPAGKRKVLRGRRLEVLL